jgi:hypothetical protein
VDLSVKFNRVLVNNDIGTGPGSQDILFYGPGNTVSAQERNIVVKFKVELDHDRLA